MEEKVPVAEKIKALAAQIREEQTRVWTTPAVEAALLLERNEAREEPNLIREEQALMAKDAREKGRGFGR